MIADRLREHIKAQVDGRESVLFLRERNFQWKQMEWFGFLVEFAGRSLIRDGGFTDGPKYGRTAFDLRGVHVWDLKAHSSHEPDLVLNDVEAIDSCLAEFGGCGFVVVNGTPTWDDSGEFKSWHDALKGPPSRYVLANAARNARSRPRKTGFAVSSIDVLWLSAANVTAAITSGELAYFQQGMRNSNGRGRRAKYRVPKFIPGSPSSLKLASFPVR